MTEASRGDDDRRAWYRPSLGDLAVWVLGAAVYLSLVRGTQRMWVESTVTKIRYLDVDRCLTIALLAPALLLGGRLAVQVIVLVVRARLGSRSRREAAAGVVIRVAALAAIGLLAAGSARILALDPDQASWMTGWKADPWQVRIASVGVMLGEVGVILAMKAARPRRRPAPRRPLQWVLYLLVGVAAVLFLVQQNLEIGYLVLLALEAVSIAQYNHGHISAIRAGLPADPVLVDRSLWVPLQGRMDLAAVHAAIGLVLAAITATWLSRDARRTAGSPRTLVGTASRFVICLATTAWGTFLVRRGISLIHPNLARGYEMVLESPAAAIAAIGFLTIAAGIAMRVACGSQVDETPVPGEPRMFVWGRRAVAGAIGGVAVVLTLTAIDKFRDAPTFSWYAPWPLTSWVHLLLSPFQIDRGDLVIFDVVQTPEAIALLAALAWIVVAGWPLAVPGKKTGEVAPIDRVTGDARLLGRFVLAWAATIAVILTLFPALLMGAFAVVSFQLRG